MKRILLFLFVIAVCLAISESPVLLAGPPKVLLCHVPPGNPAKAHVISVSPSAVPAHLAHGETALRNRVRKLGSRATVNFPRRLLARRIAAS